MRASKAVVDAMLGEQVRAFTDIHPGQSYILHDQGDYSLCMWDGDEFRTSEFKIKHILNSTRIYRVRTPSSSSK